MNIEFASCLSVRAPDYIVENGALNVYFLKIELQFILLKDRAKLLFESENLMTFDE